MDYVIAIFIVRRLCSDGRASTPPDPHFSSPLRTRNRRRNHRLHRTLLPPLLLLLLLLRHPRVYAPDGADQTGQEGDEPQHSDGGLPASAGDERSEGAEK